MGEPMLGWFKERVRTIIGLDLDDYSSRQLDHRLEFILHQTGVESYSEYALLLERDAEARHEFLRYLKINVSSFFRDPGKWKILAEEVIPNLVDRATQRLVDSVFGPGSPEIRTWSAGCSVGAEPYTLAMILKEAADKSSFSFLPILATDVVPEILDRAREGYFTENDVKDVVSYLRTRYLERKGGRWRVCKEIRKKVRFVLHDFLKDTWSTGYDLILCRNVLIYINEDVRERLYRRFWKSLVPGGVLFMGAPELILQPEEYGFSSITASMYRKVK